jgi:hypothetical protein
MSQTQHLAPCTALGTTRKPSIDEEESTRVVLLMYRPMMQEAMIIDKFCPEYLYKININ